MKFQRFIPIIGIVIFIYILWNMDLQKIAFSLRSIDPVMLFLAVLIIVPIIVLKALKWNILVSSCGIDQSLTSSISRWVVGFSIGIVTPGRLGDLSRSYYLKEKTSLGMALTTVVTDRLIDVIILFVLTIVGLSFLFTSYTIGNILLPVLLLFIAVLVGTLAFTKKSVVAFVLKPFFRRFIPKRYKPKLGSLFKDFYNGIDFMRRKKSFVSLSIIICIVAWIISIFQYYVLSLSMGLGISYSFLFMIAPLTALLDALPISFSGLGTRDVVMIYFFGLIGIAAESAVAFSIMILIVNYMLIGIVGMVLWIKNPINTRGPIHTANYPRATDS